MLYVQKKKYDCGSFFVDLLVILGEIGMSIVSGFSKIRMSIVSRVREIGQCSVICFGKNNVCLRIVLVIVRGKGEFDQIMINVLFDFGLDVILCDVSFMDKFQLVG